VEEVEGATDVDDALPRLGWLHAFAEELEHAVRSEELRLPGGVDVDTRMVWWFEREREREKDRDVCVRDYLRCEGEIRMCYMI
jgi:hypothetical protein